MKNNLFRILAVVAIVIGVAACRMAPLYNAENVQFDHPISTANAATAIKRGAASLGWRTEKVAGNHIVATINVRGKHTAIVDITYSGKGFSIMRKETQNLRYDPATGKIHKNYNSWVQNLQNAIVLEASQL